MPIYNYKKFGGEKGEIITINEQILNLATESSEMNSKQNPLKDPKNIEKVAPLKIEIKEWLDNKDCSKDGDCPVNDKGIEYVWTDKKKHAIKYNGKVYTGYYELIEELYDQIADLRKRLEADKFDFQTNTIDISKLKAEIAEKEKLLNQAKSEIERLKSIKPIDTEEYIKLNNQYKELNSQKQIWEKEKTDLEESIKQKLIEANRKVLAEKELEYKESIDKLRAEYNLKEDEIKQKNIQLELLGKNPTKDQLESILKELRDLKEANNKAMAEKEAEYKGYLDKLRAEYNEKENEIKQKNIQLELLGKNPTKDQLELILKELKEANRKELAEKEEEYKGYLEKLRAEYNEKEDEIKRKDIQIELLKKNPTIDQLNELTNKIKQLEELKEANRIAIIEKEEEYKGYLEKLRAEYNEKKAEVNRKDLQLEILGKNPTKDQLHQLELQIEDLTKRLEDLKKQKDDEIKVAKEEGIRNLEEVNKKLLEKDTKIADLTSRLAACPKNESDLIQRLRNEINGLIIEKEKIIVEREDVKKELTRIKEDLGKKIEKLNEDLLQNNRQIQIITNDGNKKNNELKISQDRINRLENQIVLDKISADKALRDQKEILAVERKNIDNEKKSLEKQLEKLRSDLSNCKNSTGSETIESLIKPTRDALASAENTLKIKEEEIKRLNAIIAEKERNLKELGVRLNGEISAINNKLIEANQRLLNCNPQEAALLKQQIGFLTVEKETATRNWEATKSQLEDLRNKSIAEIKSIKEEAEQNLFKSKRGIESLVKKIQLLETQLKTTINKDEYTRVVKELDDARLKLEANKNIKEEADQNLFKSKRGIESLVQKIQLLETQLKTTINKDEYTRVVKELDDARIKLEADKNIKEEANQNLFKSKRGIESLVKKIQLLETQLKTSINNADYTKVVQELASAKIQLEADKNDIKELTMNLEKIRATHSNEIKSIRDEAKKEVDAINGKLNEANQRLLNCNPQEAAQLRQKIGFLTVEKETATRNWNKAQSQLLELRAVHSNEIKSIKDEAKKEVDAINGKLIEANQRLLNCNPQEADQLRQKIGFLTVERDSAKRNWEGAKSQLEELRTRSIGEIKSIKEEAEQKLFKSKRGIESLVQKIQLLEKQLKTSINNSDHTKVVQELANSKIQLEADKNDIKVATMNLEKIRTAHSNEIKNIKDEAKKEFDAINGKLIEANQRLLNCNPQEAAQLKQKIGFLTVERDSAKRSLDIARSQLEELRNTSKVEYDKLKVEKNECVEKLRTCVSPFEKVELQSKLNNVTAELASTKQLLLQYQSRTPTSIVESTGSVQSSALFTTPNYDIIEETFLNDLKTKMNAKSGGLFKINSFEFENTSKSLLKSIFSNNNITSFNIADFKYTAELKKSNVIVLRSEIPKPKSNIYRFSIFGLYKQYENKFIITSIGKVKEFLGGLNGGINRNIAVTINLEKLNKLNGGISDQYYDKYMKYKQKYAELKMKQNIV